MLLAALLCILAPSAFQQGAISVDSRLERVTVFPERALVERVFEYTADRAGRVELRIGDLPVAAERESIQVRVEQGALEVEGLEVRLRNAVETKSARARELRADLDEARGVRRVIQTRLVGIESRQEVLNALIASGGLSLSGMELDRFMEEMARRSMALDEERAAIEVEVNLQESVIDDLQRDYASETTAARPVQELTLPVRFSAPGTARLRLLYLVTGASWEPSYELRVATDLTGVSMTQVGRVRQSTGEDWNSVELMLTTSMPSGGLVAPNLPRRFFQLPFTSSPDLEGLAAQAYGTGAQGPNGNRGSGRVNTPVVALFRVSGTRNVRSSSEVVRFQLTSLPLDVRPERYVVPSVSDQAWLRAEVRYNGDKPLIPGRGKVYLGGDLLGETQIPLMQSGDRTVVSLGPDPNIRVRFQPTLDERREPGILSSTARIVRAFQAEIQLDANAPALVRVLVEERLPRSRDERIEVKPVRMQPSPLDDDSSEELQEQQGLYRWRFDLAPGATRRMTWGYEAAFNEDLDPVLVERVVNGG